MTKTKRDILRKCCINQTFQPPMADLGGGVHPSRPPRNDQIFLYFMGVMGNDTA